MIALLWAGLALAAGHHVVRTGETVETIALGLGDPTSSEELRRLNGLADTEQPSVGAVLDLPGAPGQIDQGALLLTSSGELVTVRVGPGAGPVSVRPGTAIPAGATVCTGADSFASLRLAVDVASRAHDDVSLLPGTCLKLEEASSRQAGRSSLLRVESGSIAVRAVQTGAGTVTVRTRDGLLTGEKGGFRVTVEADATRTEALTDPVSVMGQGVEVRLDAQQGNRVREGQAPEDPVPLLPAGAPIRPEIDAQLRWTDFGWTPVPEAFLYLVEFSRDEDFTDIVHLHDVEGTLWQPPYLVLPYRSPALYWRVSAFDLLGFEGMPSDPRSLQIPPGIGP